MFKHILVPLDGSTLSERALTPALTIGDQDGGEVTLLRTPVVEVSAVPAVELFGNYNLRGLDEAVSKAQREANEYLEAVQRANLRANLRVHTQITDGDPAEAILHVAATKRVDLIVMSTHGYSGITRWIMGSVTERVVAHAPCPVLVIRSDTPFKHMLIPLDGSPLSEKCLAPALDVASAFGASVTLLRATKEVRGDRIQELETVEHGLGLRVQDELTEEAQDYLHGLAQKFAPGHPVSLSVRTGPAPSAILNYAELHDTDVVAMATHGRTGAQRWVYGSVTEKVLHNSTGFAMLIVRPQS